MSRRHVLMRIKHVQISARHVVLRIYVICMRHVICTIKDNFVISLVQVNFSMRLVVMLLLMYETWFNHTRHFVICTRHVVNFSGICFNQQETFFNRFSKSDFLWKYKSFVISTGHVKYAIWWQLFYTKYSDVLEDKFH